MVEQQGRVVAIEADAIWVEAMGQQGCHGCVARSGCGTGLLSDYLAGKSRIRVDLNSWNPMDLSLNDKAVIGIPEHTLTAAAMLVYLLPLACLMLAALVGEALAGERGAIIGAAGGLVLGAALVHWHSRRNRTNPSYTPLLLRIESHQPD
ncbi:SoxR reducing system RseC family protein [Microbulbifer sp. TYP-18]|uniref:SoxR reducing system RseC family protein n=1 Tax=Microbulbifer sp. TYP-18 TaxID=3230024 RepID=UPI0034C6870A